MDPRQFQRVAAELAERSDAAALRTAVGRAYYAVYGFGVATLKEMNVPISEGPAGHGEIQRLLANSGDVDAVRVGSDLHDLHHMRIRADYQMARRDVETPGVVRALVLLAGELVQALERCAREPGRSRVIQGIAEYRRRIGG